MIYDKSDRLTGSNADTLWNTLHFKTYSSGNSSNVTLNNNIFELDAGNNVDLYGVIGSSDSFYNVADDDLPYGGFGNHNDVHTRIKSVTNEVETQYLTML